MLLFLIFVNHAIENIQEFKMSFFDFFKRKNKTENIPQSTMQKLANHYLVELDDYWIPFGRPERNYNIRNWQNYPVIEWSYS